MFWLFLLANCRTSQAQGKTCSWVLSWQALRALTEKAVIDPPGCHWVIWAVWVSVALCCPSVSPLQCPECFCCRKHFSVSQEGAFEENVVFAATPTILPSESHFTAFTLEFPWDKMDQGAPAALWPGYPAVCEALRLQDHPGAGWQQTSNTCRDAVLAASQQQLFHAPVAQHCLLM